MSELFISLHYDTIDDIAEKVMYGLGWYGEIGFDDEGEAKSWIVRSIREYFEEHDVQGVLRNERPEKRTRAPFRSIGD